MDAKSGRTDTGLATKLFQEPYRFDFFQAVRLLARIYPQRLPVGCDNDPMREIARFRTSATLKFPPSQLCQLSANELQKDNTVANSDLNNAEPKDIQAQLTQAFMGLTGPLGVLPSHYTELLIDRKRYKDTAIWEFLDIFNHRLLSLFYRAWEKYRFTVAYERGDDRFSEYLFNIIGLGTRGLQNRMEVRDEGLLRYCGLIAQKPHSAGAIAAILSDYFGVPVELQQFVGQWLKLEPESISRLGRANNRLGLDTIVGTRVWDCQSKFRVLIGPLSYKQFQNFLPNGTAFNSADELSRFLAGLEFDFDLQLILKASEVPACQLAREPAKQMRLGWTSWLKTRPFSADDRQVILSKRNLPQRQTASYQDTSVAELRG